MCSCFASGSEVLSFRCIAQVLGDVEQWLVVAACVSDALDRGVSVLVHCMAGIHRAPVCMAGVLAIILQISFQEAYRFVEDSGRYVEPDQFQKVVGAQILASMLQAVGEARVAFIREGQGEQDVACSEDVLAVPEQEVVLPAGDLEMPVHEDSGNVQVLCSDLSVDYGSKLGEGGFGVVYRGVHLATGEACAVKCVAADSLVFDEVALHGELLHANVVRLLGHLVGSDQVFVALELCCGGDLYDCMKNRAGAPFSCRET